MLSLATLSMLGTILIAPISIQNVEAGSISKTYSGSFSKKWEKSASTSDGAGVLTYGYNTALINEDYAHGYHANKKHYTSISNGNGSHVSGNASKGNLAKIEVTHKGSSITYSMNF